MTTAVGRGDSIPWWKEPTRDHWRAWWGAWLGWTLAGFDFGVLILIIVPIAKEFDVSVAAAVAAVVTVPLWVRLVGAVASGWLADRVGRKIPLMISILLYSICNFIAGFSPTLAFLFLFRMLLGVGVGAEWPAGATLAMESWPARSRGLMGGILQGSWAFGILLASLLYGALYESIGWRGMLWIGILPALAAVYVLYFVSEPAIWLENRRKQREEKREVRVPLFSIFKPLLLGNTLTACWWIASASVVYFSTITLFSTYVQKDLNLSPGLVAAPLAFANLVTFFGMGFWGWLGDKIGRRWSIIVQSIVTCLVAPSYLLTTDVDWIFAGLVLQGFSAAAMTALSSSYLAERFPTEVRATACAVCFSLGGILGGMATLLLTYFASNHSIRFAMLVGMIVGSISIIVSMCFSPETKGKVLVSDLVVT